MTPTDLPANRLRCSGCKSYRQITDYLMQGHGYRASTCRVCKDRKRDQYREKKGEFVKERHDRRIRREEAAKIRRQRRGIWTPEERASREVTRREQEEEGQRWVKLSDDELQWHREEAQWEIEQDWQWDEVDIFTNEFTELIEQSRKSYVTFTDPQRTFEGWQTAGELWEAQQPAVKPLIEPLTNESFGIARYCSSCAQIRPPSAFGRFYTCLICRKRKAPSNARQKEFRRHQLAVQPRPADTTLREILRKWTDFAGEQELRERHQIKRYGRVAFPEEVLRRPLAVEDYIENQ